MRNIYFIGTAGSGKSSLVNAFREWMEMHGFNDVTLNLDPGAEMVPYAPDIDIRDWVRLDDVMNEYGLGPNGAQIVCSDMIALKTREIVSIVDTFRSDYLLIDTPGQMELFAFRQSSSVVVEALGKSDSFFVFLSDPLLSKTPSGFVSSLMLCAITHFRFLVPILNVLSKSDTINEEDVETILSWSRDPYTLYDALGQEQGTSQTILSIEFFKAMESIGMYRELTPVSSRTPFGMEDIYNTIQQVFEGGEDLSTD
ncbi:MAG: ATP/GTP-binding protein [Methanomassiliicoccales archaeon]|nr:ATP/GTP-binding protein [Methanomassiliicoccales archaeon]